MAFDVYPGLEAFTQEGTYNEMVSLEDIAQVETNAGKILPNNLKMTSGIVTAMTTNALQMTDREQ